MKQLIFCSAPTFTNWVYNCHLPVAIRYHHMPLDKNHQLAAIPFPCIPVDRYRLLAAIRLHYTRFPHPMTGSRSY